MPAISDASIASYAKAVGLNNSQTAIAVAIALAESSGNPQAHNSVPPDNSYGLWQINMLGSLGPSRRQQFDIATNDQLFDPMTNARAMNYLSNGGQNWRAWTTYTRGTYLRYLSRGQAVAGTGAATGGPNVVPTSLGDTLDGLKALLTLPMTPGIWVRVGLTVLGTALLIYGMFKVTGDNQISDKTKALVSAIPGGGLVVQAAKGALKK